MKRYLALIGILLAVSITAFNAFGQDDELAAQIKQAENMRERFRNMSPQERKKLRAEFEEQRKKYQNMSEEDRAKFRAEIRERYGSRSPVMNREQQLAKIAVIEKQLARLKKSVESVDSKSMSNLRDLSESERTKLREKISKSAREQQMIIRDIEQQLATLKGSRTPSTISEARLNELRAIQKLAVREKASQTADRLDKLIMGYQRSSAGREPVSREGESTPRRERPARKEKSK